MTRFPSSHELVVLTDRGQARGDLLGVVGAAVSGGARVVMLREKDLPQGERRALALGVASALRPVGGTLLIASDVALAGQVDADGVHLAADDPWPDEPPAVAGRRMLVGRSCHSAEQLLSARRHGADYATLSPVFSTMSKPGYGPPLGLEYLTSACRHVSEGLPVIALGGIRTGRVAPCLAAGAAGVAVMGEVMRAGDPAGQVRELLDEVGSAQGLGVPR